MNRDILIAGNWKMNKTAPEARELSCALLEQVKNSACRVLICPSFVSLQATCEALKGSAIEVGAQNCHDKESGAFTGEVSAPMLKAIGVSQVILGHSERRQYCHETDETVNLKLKAALEAGLCAIVCVGESEAQHENGQTAEVIEAQVKGALLGIPAQALASISIAYEPIWAIGTGKTASALQADEVCGLIRRVIGTCYDAAAAEALLILYGGSMNDKNAAELLSMPEVDGGLIGGAALKAEAFLSIIQAGEALLRARGTGA